MPLAVGTAAAMTAGAEVAAAAAAARRLQDGSIVEPATVAVPADGSLGLGGNKAVGTGWEAAAADVDMSRPGLP